MRVFYLVVAVLLLGVGAAYTALYMGHWKELVSPIAESGKEFMTVDELALSNMLLFSRCGMRALIYIFALLGSVILAHTLGNWRRHLSDALMAKVLRAWLQGIAGPG